MHLTTVVRTAAIALALAPLGACSRLSPEMQVVANAADAMGGATRLQAIRSLTMEGNGRDLAVGGSVTPEAPPNVNLVTQYRRTLDAAAPRMRTRQVRTAQYQFANAVIVRQDQGLDGPVAYNVPAAGPGGAPAEPQRAGDGVARDRRGEWLRHPLSLVRAALDPAATVTNLRTEDGQAHVDVTTASGDVATLAVDPATRLPSHISMRGYDPNWGDVILEAQFSEYADVGGVKLPTIVVTKQDQWTTTERTLTSQGLDGELEDLAASDAVKAASAPTPPAPTVTVEEVVRASGGWRGLPTAASRSSSTTTSRCSRCRSTRLERRPSSSRPACCGPASLSPTPWCRTITSITPVGSARPWPRG